MNTREEITGFKPSKEFFAGIDSDGTAFDSMNIKHLEAFIPAALETWDFGSRRIEFEEIWRSLNLYSKSRGINRFLALRLVLEKIWDGDIGPLRDFAEKSETLSNASLQLWMKEHPDPLLDDIMRWSLRADELFEKHTQGLLPYANVEAALKVIAEKADIMVVSSASGRGLDKDWSFSELTRYTALLAGQEAGSKSNQLRMGAGGKYPPDKILMIGDAPGDLEAARSIDALFFPVIPGREEASWLRLREEGSAHFFAGSFKGEYEDALIREFMAVLE